MSYHAWTTDGFGFCVSNISTTEDKLFDLLEKAPNTCKKVYDWIDITFPESEVTKSEIITIEELDEYEGNYGSKGVCCMLREVIEELEGIPLVSCEDFDSNQYILFEPTYPWSVQTDKIKTKEDIGNIFKKYISMLTDEEVSIDYQSVQNGS